MNDISKRLCALSAGVLMTFSLALPAMAAAPRPALQTEASGGNVVLVQYRRHHGRHFRMHRGNPYYRGHRGYRHRHHGYRYYNGYWFPPSAFIAGAIIGGAIAAPPPRYRGNAHVRWCRQHYRSYDVRSDTFQPYNGPRRRCVSPY